MKKNLLLIVLFIAIIFFGRILPHPYNFTPLIAVTLLSSYSLSNKFLAIMIPLVGFWISDLFMNNYIYAGYFTDFTVFNSGMIWTYGAIVLVAFMGSSFLNKISTGKREDKFGLTEKAFLNILNNHFLSWGWFSPSLTGIFFSSNGFIPSTHAIFIP